MAYTVPTTRANGFVVGATEWNADIVENIKFLADPPRASAYRTTSLSIPDVSETILTLPSEHWDTDSMHSTSVNTGRFTCNTAGVYLVRMNVMYAASTGYQVIQMYLNGTAGTFQCQSESKTVAVATTLICEKEVALAVGEYIETTAYQNTGGAVNVLTGSFVQVRMISRS